MTKLIIIEGSDLSGKTTIIERVSKALNNGIIIKNAFKPRSKDEAGRIREQYNFMLSLIRKSVKLDKNEQFIIMDRFYQSQMVYSFKRGTDEMNDRFYSRFETRLARIENLEVFYVWITAPDSDLEKRFYKRGEDYLKVEELKTINKRYRSIYDKSLLNKIKVDNENESSIDYHVNRIINLVKNG